MGARAPERPFRCLVGTDIDMLVVDNSVVRKQERDLALKVKYEDQFELD